MSEITLRYNALEVHTYLTLRDKVHWKRLTGEQARLALERSLYVVTAYLDDVCVGMGRLVGDGAVICYVQDLIVLPEAQRMGIGSRILEALKDHVETLRMEGTEMMLCLMCAKGREAFYEAHGFTARPTDTLGPGMIRYLNALDK